MIVKFKEDWSCAERGIHVREFKKDQTYSDMADEDAKLAIELGKATEVKESKAKTESDQTATTDPKKNKGK